MDCEGSEVFIFREENTGFFSTHVHKIALEFHNEKKDEIIKFLRDAGYEVHVDNGNNNLGMLYAKNLNFTKGICAYPPEQARIEGYVDKGAFGDSYGPTGTFL